MLSPLRNRFGIPGVISVIALVFAMLGGAYAAGNSGSDGPKASASAKGKPGPPGKRGKPGPPGPTGPQGPAGPAGPKGDTGAAGANGNAGTNGTNGTNGKTVLSGTAVPTIGVGTDGDFYIETDAGKIYGPKAGGAWPAGVSLKGEPGDPWSVGGTLPSGKTETGTFAVTGNAADTSGIATPISFPIQLAAPLPEANVHYITPASPNANCGGTVAEPTAVSGHLCVYQGIVLGLPENPSIFTPEFGGGASKTGAVLSFGVPIEEGATGAAFGSWAVTAP